VTVDDAAASNFVERFYRAFLATPQSIVRARSELQSIGVGFAPQSEC